MSKASLAGVPMVVPIWVLFVIVPESFLSGSSRLPSLAELERGSNRGGRKTTLCSRALMRRMLVLFFVHARNSTKRRRVLS